MNDFSGNFIQYDNKKRKDETKNLALYFVVHITLYIVLFFFLLFFAWYTAFATSHDFYAVYNVSMKGTLNSEIADNDPDRDKKSLDAVYIDKYGELKIFDIVVLENTSPSEESTIKRLMAFEGDYISIAQTQDANGNNILAFYRIAKGTDLNQETFDDESAKVDETSGANGYTIKSAQEWWNVFGRYVNSDLTVDVNGQTKTVRYDEKFFEKFLKDFDALDQQTKNENFFISKNGMVYVKVPKGKIFYMGDNRAHSDDARDFGFADKTNVVGRTEIIVYDYNFANRLLEVVKFYFKQVEEFFAR